MDMYVPSTPGIFGQGVKETWRSPLEQRDLLRRGGIQIPPATMRLHSWRETLSYLPWNDPSREAERGGLGTETDRISRRF